mmetsp:Transcript_86208/g.222032  ORF Transcript_86208/g.222032 Transcript_86208/m.222032 type:complete len:333 (+) Transcript_86208:1854-2852(+)
MLLVVAAGVLCDHVVVDLVRQRVGRLGAAGDPRMLHDLAGVGPALLVLVEHDFDELFASRMDPLWDLRHLALDVVFVLEREARRDQAEHDDAQRPHVHLQAVALRVDLRCPVHLRPALYTQTVLGPGFAGHAEVGEDDLAQLVRDVLPVEEVVVALDVSVHDPLVVAVLDGRGHLVREVGHLAALHLPLCPEVVLHARHHVAAGVEVHDDADETPLVEDAMALDDVRVVQSQHQPSLFLDHLQGRLHLVDHLDGALHSSHPVLAQRDHAEGALAQLFPHHILVEQLLLLLGWLRAGASSRRLAAAHRHPSGCGGGPPAGDTLPRGGLDHWPR